ncbi:LpxL/LpxP family Kdo(2)-lipid IV(A) lauroyl/palmitoleoyl acyltransferase [Thioalkalivibrio sulfidiphilus]|uniref:LpxL/LpxP family Kdo(2)-lipid IV(A) lauroyl/palmitoleoyl acyltransferase n=1 Tax=Thioalkalivibrio sulfidiphilus TaxID=1033854 RepID=UPI0003A1AE57|nr:LpxL/LpxP family Kdo(2)-lipid IV(A) lauroyl/palmitoleoyl acyltransferase [Thioalkalivibrio sulfidiphilus]
MSKTSPPQSLWHPRHWPMWLGVGLLWAASHMPWRWQIRLGEALGSLAWHLARSRRHVAQVNVDLCFPSLEPAARRELVREHFRAMGAALFETPFGWWADDRRLQPLAHIEGLEHLKTALEGGKGVLLLSAHFTTLEIAGRLLVPHQPFAAMYRPHENPVIEYCFRRNREHHCQRAIRRDKAKDVIRALRDNLVVWYAPDQAYKAKNSTIVPFFGVPAATNNATARLAKISGAPVVPFFGYRLPGSQGYRLVIGAPLEHFPIDDAESDAQRINEVVEKAVMEAPAQYFWTHRRFKYKRNWGIPDPYRK